jgi:hypothetical protein
MLDQLMKNNSLNSGRLNRNNINSTTIRNENSNSNNGRMFIKKALSPPIENPA